MSSHASASASAPGQTGRYALPKGKTEGYVTVSDGTHIYVILTPFVSTVAKDVSKEAIVDVCVRAAHGAHCDWVRIR